MMGTRHMIMEAIYGMLDAPRAGVLPTHSTRAALVGEEGAQVWRVIRRESALKFVEVPRAALNVRQLERAAPAVARRVHVVHVLVAALEDSAEAKRDTHVP